MIFVGWYLFVGMAIGATVLATFPEEDRGPGFFLLPGLIVPIFWGPIVVGIVVFGRWL